MKIQMKNSIPDSPAHLDENRQCDAFQDEVSEGKWVQNRSGEHSLELWNHRAVMGQQIQHNYNRRDFHMFDEPYKALVCFV